MSNQIEESGAAFSGSDAPTSASGNQSDSQISQSDAEVSNLFSKLQPIVDSYIETKLKPFAQSIKDKRIAEIQKEIAELKQAKEAGLVAAGIPEKEAKEIVSQIIPERVVPSQTPQTNSGVGNALNVSELQRAVLGLAGLNESDPDVVLLSQKNLAPDQFANEVQGIVTRRRNPPPMSSAMQPAMGTSTHIDRDALFEELEELQMRDPLDRTGRIAKLKSDLGIR